MNMKVIQVLSLLLLTCTCFGLKAQNNSLLIEDFTVKQGTQQEISVLMNNQADITTIAFDLYLPQGLTIAIDDFGDEMIDYGSRTNYRRHSFTTKANSDRSVHIEISPLRATNTFTGTSGDVLIITLDVASTLSNGSTNLMVKNQKLTAAAGTIYRPIDFTTAIRISDGLENANSLAIEGFTAEAGEQVVLPILLNNNSEISVLQFDLTLPEGISFATDEEGDELISFSPRTKAGSHVYSFRKQSSGTWRFVVTSPTNATFSGQSGEVMTIVLDIARSMEAGEYDMSITNQVLTTPRLKEYAPEDVNVNVNVTKTLIPVSELSIPTSFLFIYVGNQVKLPVTVAPDNADDSTFTWNIDDPTICDVDADGNVTALKQGVTTLHLVANDTSNLSATCKIVTSDLSDSSQSRFDLNADGKVSISDVTTLTNAILLINQQ